MEIVIQTNKNMWSISSRGIRKVSTWDWRKIKETFERLFEAQILALKVAHENQGPVFDGIERAVEAGYLAAPKNAAAWRAQDDNALP